MIFAIIITLEILFIAYMIWDNVTWQQKVLRSSGVPQKPKPKFKLKKGQRVSFGDDNPFEERQDANTSS